MVNFKGDEAGSRGSGESEVFMYVFYLFAWWFWWCRAALWEVARLGIFGLCEFAHSPPIVLRRADA